MLNTSHIEQIRSAYFIGIGGIGMSAIARYMNLSGIKVSGYDKTATPLTDKLREEGIAIRFKEEVNHLPEVDIVVYTPAIPDEHEELQAYRASGACPVVKRSEVLAILAKDKFTIAVAGTHGKTSVSSMIAHILHHSGHGCTAFIGGLMTNYGTNLITGNDDVIVLEADEYDRSFLRLYPNIAVVTACDADHLDIYGTKQNMEQAYVQFLQQINENGKAILKEGLTINSRYEGAKLTYHQNSDTADIAAKNVNAGEGAYIFDWVRKDKDAHSFQLPLLGRHNVENALAAISVATELGVPMPKIVSALKSFKGIQRRFEYVLRTQKAVIIDDYAHHPAEIKAALSAVREIYPQRHMTVVFQPHLFTRTRDFANGFAQSLDMADEVFLLPIYPARELPIENISSAVIYNLMELENKTLIGKDDLLTHFKKNLPNLLVLLGAGDINRLILKIGKNIASQVIEQ